MTTVDRKRERSPDLILGSDDDDGGDAAGEDSSSNEPPMSKPKLDPFAEDEVARPRGQQEEEEEDGEAAPAGEEVYEFDESKEYVSDDDNDDECERKAVKKGRKATAAAKRSKAAKKAPKAKAKEKQQQPMEEPSKINVYSLGFEDPEDGLEGRKGRAMTMRAAAGAVTAEGRLKAKLSRESNDGNLVKINLKKKTFVRGKKSMTGAKVGDTPYTM